jgi:hypothetical protein
MPKPVHETEVIRRIHDAHGFLEIGTSPDSPIYIQLRTTSPESIEYWGELDLNLLPDLALALGQALIAAARDKGAKE